MHGNEAIQWLNVTDSFSRIITTTICIKVRYLFTSTKNGIENPEIQ